MAGAGEKEGSERIHAIKQHREMGKGGDGEWEKQSLTEAERDGEKDECEGLQAV